MQTGLRNASKMPTWKSPSSDRSTRSDESSPVEGATSTAAPVSASKDTYSEKDEDLEYARIEIQRLRAKIKQTQDRTNQQCVLWSE